MPPLQPLYSAENQTKTDRNQRKLNILHKENEDIQVKRSPNMSHEISGDKLANIIISSLNVIVKTIYST